MKDEVKYEVNYENKGHGSHNTCKLQIFYTLSAKFDTRYCPTDRTNAELTGTVKDAGRFMKSATTSGNFYFHLVDQHLDLHGTTT